MLRLTTGAARLCSALVTLTAALAACAPASAATAPRPATIYGGGTSQDAPIAIQVSRDHRRLVRLLEYVTAKCSNGALVTEAGPVPFSATPPTFIQANTLLGDTLPRSGRFRYTGLAAEHYGDMQGALDETIAGTVSGLRAHGTYRVTIKLTAADGSPGPTCSTGTLSWKADASPGRVFAGLTGAGMPLVLRASADRRKMTDVRIGWGAGCVPDGYFGYGEHFVAFALSSTGRFGDTFDQGPTTDSDGGTQRYHYELAGTVGRTKATGSFAATATFTNADGTTQATCTQPREHWTAGS